MMWSLDKGVRILFWGCVSFFLAALFHLVGLANFLLFFPGAWLLSAGIYLLFASLKVPVAGKAVLITGCDTGFGYALALHLHTLGFRVFAGCLHADAGGEGAERLRRTSSERMHVMQLDVTDRGQINSVLHEVRRILSSREVLWGVVNNAGISTYGAIEWIPMTTFKKLAEVNIFGCVGVTKAFLPLVRKAKGRVVNVTSVEGRMASPLVAAYDLTKFAIEGFSDCLRNEMRRFGVQVSIVEPGNFTSGTSLNTDENVVRFADEMWFTMEEEVKITYGKQSFNDVVSARMIVNRSGEANLTPVTRAMVDALVQRFPQERYQPMALELYWKAFVAQHFPEWVYDYLVVELANKWS